MRIAAANDDIWLFDPGHAGLTRFTHVGGDNAYPVWTPGGDRIIFSWAPSGVMNLFCKNADGSGHPESLVTAACDQYPESVSPDSNYLAFCEVNPSTRRDIYLLPLKGERKPQPFVVTSFDEWGAKFSPNGRWIAYTSDESGREEIYLQHVQGTGGKRKVSSAGGQWPVWAHTGSELFFLNGNKLMTAKVDPASGIPGAIQELFELRNLVPEVGFDVAPDGKSFVMVVQDEQRPATELRVVLNWFEELKRLVPRGK